MMFDELPDFMLEELFISVFLGLTENLQHRRNDIGQLDDCRFSLIDCSKNGRDHNHYCLQARLRSSREHCSKLVDFSRKLDLLSFIQVRAISHTLPELVD